MIVGVKAYWTQQTVPCSLQGHLFVLCLGCHITRHPVSLWLGLVWRGHLVRLWIDFGSQDFPFSFWLKSELSEVTLLASGLDGVEMATHRILALVATPFTSGVSSGVKPLSVFTLDWLIYRLQPSTPKFFVRAQPWAGPEWPWSSQTSSCSVRFAQSKQTCTDTYLLHPQ